MAVYNKPTCNNKITYSNYDLPALNENMLNESLGVDPNGLTSGLGTIWYNGVTSNTINNIAKNGIDL